MKSQKGITLSSLIVYIIVLLIALAILVRIRISFQSNLTELNSGAENSLEYNKINMFLLQETKQVGNSIAKVGENGDYIEFENGNKYIYIQNDNAIYLCNKEQEDDIEYKKVIRIASKITNCIFSQENINEKIILKLDLTIEQMEEKKLEYVLSY